MGRDWTEEVNGAAYMNAEPTGLEGSQVARIDPEKEALRAQRDELLEACRNAADALDVASHSLARLCGLNVASGYAKDAEAKARAAIAKAEGSQG